MSIIHMYMPASGAVVDEVGRGHPLAGGKGLSCLGRVMNKTNPPVDPQEFPVSWASELPSPAAPSGHAHGMVCTVSFGHGVPKMKGVLSTLKHLCNGNQSLSTHY